jgi:hypothetical protein
MESSKLRTSHNFPAGEIAFSTGFGVHFDDLVLSHCWKSLSISKICSKPRNSSSARTEKKYLWQPGTSITSGPKKKKRKH